MRVAVDFTQEGRHVASACITFCEAIVHNRKQVLLSQNFQTQVWSSALVGEQAGKVNLGWDGNSRGSVQGRYASATSG